MNLRVAESLFTFLLVNRNSLHFVNAWSKPSIDSAFVSLRDPLETLQGWSSEVTRTHITPCCWNRVESWKRNARFIARFSHIGVSREASQESFSLSMSALLCELLAFIKSIYAISPVCVVSNFSSNSVIETLWIPRCHRLRLRMQGLQSCLSRYLTNIVDLKKVAKHRKRLVLRRGHWDHPHNYMTTHQVLFLHQVRVKES